MFGKKKKDKEPVTYQQLRAKLINGSKLGDDKVDFIVNKETGEGTEVTPIPEKKHPDPYSMTSEEVKGEMLKDLYEFFKHNARYSIFLLLGFFIAMGHYSSNILVLITLGTLIEAVFFGIVFSYFAAKYMVSKSFKHVVHIHHEVAETKTIIGVNSEEPDIKKALLYVKSFINKLDIFLRRQDQLQTKKTIIVDPVRMDDDHGNILLHTQHSTEYGKTTIYTGTLSKKYMSMMLTPAINGIMKDNEKLTRRDRLVKWRYVKAYNRMLKKAPEGMSPDEQEKFNLALKFNKESDQILQVLSEDNPTIRKFFRFKRRIKMAYIFGISQLVQDQLVQLFDNPVVSIEKSIDKTDKLQTTRIKDLYNENQSIEVVISKEKERENDAYARGQAETLSDIVSKRAFDRTIAKEDMLETSEHKKAIKENIDAKLEEEIAKGLMEND